MTGVKLWGDFARLYLPVISDIYENNEQALLSESGREQRSPPSVQEPSNLDPGSRQFPGGGGPGFRVFT